MPLSKSPTQFVVGSLIGIVLIIVAFNIANPIYAALLTILLAYEGWTFINKYPNDTISEIIWEFSKRPFVPWLFGTASGWAISSGFIDNHYMIAALFFLQGHFFFQRNS